MAADANLAPASIPSNSPLSQNFQFGVNFFLKKRNKFRYFINTRISLALRAIRPQYTSGLQMVGGLRPEYMSGAAM